METMTTRFLAAGLLILPLLALTNVVNAQRAALPAPVIPDGLGVNIHFTDPQPGEMKMLAEGGFRWVRMDFDWIRTEVEKGQYDFSAYDRLLAALKPHKIRALFILDYVHTLYDNAQSPHTEEARQAMARWAAAAVKHFRGQGILWEMYNEPNIFPFWRPKPNVDDYVKLALAVGKAIREAAPDELYIGPATSGIDLPFLEACFKGGLLEYWDAVSVHPYRQTNPETVISDYRRLRLLIAKYAPKGKTIPILSGEWGYSAAWSGMDEAKQGKMLPRQWLTNLANDVPLSIWYDWHDDGPDPKEPEHHFGTVAHPYHAGRDPVYDPKPACRAAKTLTTVLKGFRFNKRLDVDDGRDHVLLFSKGKETRLAVWTTAQEKREIRVPASPGRFRVTSHTGENLPPRMADKDGLAITLTDAPQYLVPEKPNDLLRVAAAWRRAPLECVGSYLGGYAVRLTLKNPLARTIRIKAAARTIKKARPGERIRETTFTHVTKTAAPQRMRIEWDVIGMGRIAQETQIIVTNPLIVTILPLAGRVLPVRVENPSGEAFQGRLRLSEVKGARCENPEADLRIESGEEEKIVRFNLETTSTKVYRVRIRVDDIRGQTVLLMSSTAFHPADDFTRYTADRLQAAYRLLPDGDPKVESEQTLTLDAPPDGPPVSGAGVFKILYRFAPGWKFIRLVPQPFALQDILGRPKSFGLWIYGDGEGNIPRLRFVDSTGQTFQPDGEPITWKGWRYVTFAMDGTKAGHWGGKNDGVIHYPIRWDSIFLLDSAGGHKTQGTVYISSPTLIR